MMDESHASSSWIPTTPGKPGLATLPPVTKNGEGNLQARADWSVLQPEGVAPAHSVVAQNVAANCGSEGVVTADKCFTSWGEVVGTKFNAYGDGARMFDNFSGDNVEMWSNVSFGDLLAMAHSAGTTPVAEIMRDETADSVKSSLISSHNADGSSIFGNFPFNLNSPPRTIDANLRRNVPVQFEPVTPDLIKSKGQASYASSLDTNMTTVAIGMQLNEVTRRNEANDHQQNKEQLELVLDQSELQENHIISKESKQDSEMINTPQPKQRRKRHRPKVVIEGKPTRTRKPRTEKQPGSGETKTEKKKYVRRNKVGRPAATDVEEANNTSSPEGKPPTSDEAPRAKRKYVRKNQVNKSAEKLSEEGSSGTVDPIKDLSPKSSCRGSLNSESGIQANDENSSFRQSTPSDLHVNQKESTAEEANNTVSHEEKLPTSEKTPKPRRKYVRKNQVNKDSAKLSKEGSSGTIDPIKDSGHRKSCRRSLNFELEIQASDDNSSYRQSTTSDLHVNQNESTAQSAQLGQDADATAEMTEVGKTCEITSSMNQEPRNCLSQPEMQGPPTPDKFVMNHDKVMFPNRNESTGGHCSIPLSDLTRDNQSASIQQKAPKRPIASNDSSKASLGHGKGLKRQHSDRTDETQFLNARGLYFNSVQAYQAIFPANVPEAYSNLGMPHTTDKKKRRNKSSSKAAAHTEAFESETNHVPLFQCNISGSPSYNYATSSNMLNFDFMPASVEQEGLSMRRSKATTQEDDSASPHETYKLFPASTSKEMTKCGFGETCSTSQQPNACMEAPVVDTQKAKKTKKQSKRGNRARSIASSMYIQQQFPTGTLPAITWGGMSPIDEIAYHLQHLDLNRESIQNQDQQRFLDYSTKLQGETALVLYQRDGRMVPVGNPFVKKRKPRAKVELDDETDRVWNLLLQDINSEGIDGTDEEKAKWWEEERRVFSSRADSFIARMHLVQGDRRFSPWKGSVVDSVVGVFLTQNVSDHLSSSAFMSLAAHFPLKSNNCAQKHEEKTGIIIEEPEVCETDPNATIRWHEDQQNHSPHSLSNTYLNEEKTVISRSESSENSTHCIKSAEHSVVLQSDFSGEGLDYHESTVDSFQDQRELDDLPSSPNSVVSSQNSVVVQTSERTESRNFCSSTSFTKLLEMAGTSAAQQTRCDEHLQGVNYPTFPKETSAPGQGGLREFSDSVRGTYSNGEVNVEQQTQTEDCSEPQTFSETVVDATQRVSIVVDSCKSEQGAVESNLKNDADHVDRTVGSVNRNPSKAKTGKGKEKVYIDWDNLRLQAEANCKKREKMVNTMDSLDWEAVRCADVSEIAHTIRERGMNNRLAERIKDFLNRLVREHGSLDLEWLRDVPPDKAKEYLLSFKGLGLKSVECVRLLTLHHLAFPVDTNVGRIAVRLGWVPLQPLPESLQLHLLELYPILESIQKYLWPRLCKLDQRTLYELHYQMITFGKVFCTKSKPNCNACPMRGECRHFASAFASARFALPAPEEKSIVQATGNTSTNKNPEKNFTPLPLPLPFSNQQPLEQQILINSAPIIEVPTTPEPIVEVPATPEEEQIQAPEIDIEDAYLEDPNEIPVIELNMAAFTQNLKKYVENNMELQRTDMSNALVALTSEAASIPMPKLKNVSRLRTEHHVYELPDSHPILEGMDKREQDDPCSYLLAIWTPGETADSFEPPERQCDSQESGRLCDSETCSACNSIRETHSQTVRGTILIPCRTAMRGSFPLNGTYFQVNEVFADHESSLNPINVPRHWLWNLPRRTVYFGTSIPTIFKGLTTESIQHCFWRGFVCVRGFDQKTRAPRPLMARLHFPASKLAKAKGKADEKNGEAK